MKGKRKFVRVRGVKGYGPRHMMNAQEGSEAVPSELPSPPEAPPQSYGGKALAWVADQVRQGVLPDEAIEEIKRNPASLQSMMAYANAALSAGTLLSGGGEGKVPIGDEPLIFGHTFEQIKSAQQRGRLRDPITGPATKPGATDADRALLEKHGVDGLREKNLYGVLDRLGLPMSEGDRKGKTKVGVAKGFGPMHAENSKEGEDLTKVNTDTVPAMLTPREAVLNRNAAELAGRGTIEKLNAEGNQLARKGVDLAAGGMSDVKEKIMKSKPKQSKPQSGSPYVQAFQNLMPKGGAPVGYQGGGDSVPGMGGGLGARDQYGRQFSNRDASGGFASGNGVPPQPVVDPTPGAFPGRGPGGVYPGAMPGMQGPGTPPTQQGPFQGRGPGGVYPSVPMATPLADGTSNVGPIGTPPQGEQAYGPPVNLTAPQIQQLAKQTGISPTQIMGLMKAFQGGKDIYNSVGTGGGYANQSPSAGEDFGNPNYIGLGTPSYQGGISDIGYPPFVAPSASYDGNRGGWLGPYDPSFMIQRYAGGTSYVSPFR